MKNAMKRWLSLLLTVLMVASALPFAALAEGDTAAAGLIEEDLVPVEPEQAQTTPTVNVSNAVSAAELLNSAPEEASYLEQIAVLQAEAEALDAESETLMDDCADIYARLMSVYESADAEHESGTMTDEEYEAIYNAIGAVIEVLSGYGYDPYAVVTLESYTMKPTDTHEITIKSSSINNNTTWSVYDSSGNKVSDNTVIASYSQSGSGGSTTRTLTITTNNAEAGTYTIKYKNSSNGGGNRPGQGSSSSETTFCTVTVEEEGFRDVEVEVEQGKSAKVAIANAENYVYATENLPEGLTLVASGNSVTITASATVEIKTYEVKYSSGNDSEDVETKTITINVAPTGKVKVYVYVASKNSAGDSWYDNEEFLDLIGLYVCDNNKYFPAGTIYLDASFFTGKSTDYRTDKEGTYYITSAADWSTLISALSSMNSSGLSGTSGVYYTASGHSSNYSENRGNHVSEYLSQASRDVGYTWGSQKSALFRWRWDTTSSANYHYGYPGDKGTDKTENGNFVDSGTTKLHLDLCFNTNKITFITGNNGITSGSAKDGTTVDSRLYITDSIIQPPRNLKIPDGYQFMGYYKDADFTEPWDGIGTPLNEDQTVYIKITEKDNIVLNYVVAEGQGSVSPENEAFNPDTGKPAGSTATAAENWTFDGWYADEDCTQKLSGDAKYVPVKPVTGWVTGTTYYAKFVPATASVTATKKWEDSSDQYGIRPASIELTLMADGVKVEQEGLTNPATVTAGTDGTWSYTWQNVPINDSNGNTITYTVTETAVPGYTSVITGDAANGFTVTNTLETTSVTAEKVWSDEENKYGFRPESVTLQLKSNGTDFGDPVTIKADADGKWSYVWENLPKYGADGMEVTYSVEETNVSEKYTPTYSEIVEGKITVTNTLKTHTLTIKKQVEGNMGSWNKQFAFTTSYGDGDKTANLVHDGTAEYTVPYGATVEVTENPDGYTLETIAVETGNVTPTEIDNGASFTMPDEDVTIIFTNSNEAEVDTGILLDSLPYVLILALVAVALVVWFARRRRDD